MRLKCSTKQIKFACLSKSHNTTDLVITFHRIVQNKLIFIYICICFIKYKNSVFCESGVYTVNCDHLNIWVGEENICVVVHLVIQVFVSDDDCKSDFFRYKVLAAYKNHFNFPCTHRAYDCTVARLNNVTGYRRLNDAVLANLRPILTQSSS